jgi:hypothetical protein
VSKRGRKSAAWVLFHVPTRTVYPAGELEDNAKTILKHGGRLFTATQEGDGHFIAWQGGPPGWPGGLVEAGRGETFDDMLRDVIGRALEGNDWIMGTEDGKCTVGEVHKPWKHLVEPTE